jgi:hypothetical protein
MFRRKEEEATGERRKLYNRSFITKYYYADKVKKFEMGEICRTHIVIINAYEILVWKPAGKRPHGRPTRK